MELNDFKWWGEFKERYNGTSLKAEDFTKLCDLHAKYFNHTYYKPCACNGGRVIKEWAKQLEGLYSTPEPTSFYED